MQYFCAYIKHYSHMYTQQIRLFKPFFKTNCFSSDVILALKHFCEFYCQYFQVFSNDLFN